MMKGEGASRTLVAFWHVFIFLLYCSVRAWFALLFHFHFVFYLCACVAKPQVQPGMVVFELVKMVPVLWHRLRTVETDKAVLRSRRAESEERLLQQQRERAEAASLARAEVIHKHRCRNLLLLLGLHLPLPVLFSPFLFFFFFARRNERVCARRWTTTPAKRRSCRT